MVVEPQYACKSVWRCAGLTMQLITNRGRALKHADLPELIRVAGFGRDEDHRAEASGALAQVGDFGLDGDAIAGPDRFEIFPVGAAVESAKRLAHVELDIRDCGRERSRKGRRRDHPAKARLARVTLAVEERIGVADRLGEAANRTAFDFECAGLAGLADLLQRLLRYVLVRHLHAPRAGYLRRAPIIAERLSAARRPRRRTAWNGPSSPIFPDEF